MILEYAYLDNLQIHKAGGLSVTKVTLGSPTPRAVVENRPSDHGSVDSTSFYGPRSIEVTGQVQAPSMEAFWPLVDNLLGKLALGSEHTFRFRRLGDAFDLQVTVRVDSNVDLPVADPATPKPYARWGVSLYCADPRIYTSTQTAGSYDPMVSGAGGLVFPLTFPLVFAAPGGAGSMSLDNKGNVSTPPTIVVTGPVTNPIVDNDTLGLSIRTRNCGLAAGDTLTLDAREHTVVLNGTTLRPDLVDVARTTWWDLRPGVNQVRLRGTGMVAAQTELSVAFRAARI